MSDADPEFDEQYYLRRHPDIQAAVSRGIWATGYDHYIKHGKAEGRDATPKTSDDKKLYEAETELAAVFEKHNGASYLTPTDLTVTATQIRRLLLIGPCGIEFMFDMFKRMGQSVDFVLRVQRGELPDLPPQPAFEYDFQVIEITLRSLFVDGALWSTPYNQIEEYQRAFDRACSELRAQLKASLKWNQSFNLLTFVMNFAKPQDNLVGRLLPQYDIRNPVYMIDKLNEVLEKEVLSYSNAYVLNIDNIKSSYGRRFVQDDSYEHITHHSFLNFQAINMARLEAVPAMVRHYHNHSEEIAKGIWSYLVSLYRSVKQIDAIKIVIVDLDDTMWKGVAGDSEFQAAESIEGWPLGTWEALGYLKKRGILLAIISKNDEAHIREMWGRIIGARFSLDQFAVVKINWRPKAENMKELLAEVNLLPRSALFIDDHPVERAAMKAAFPDMRIIGRFYYYVRRILLWSSETQVPFITEESANRTEMVRAQVERETARREMPREEFLMTLGLVLTMREVKGEADKSFNRAFELTNKTNQFNTTGKRWAREEFVGWFAKGGRVFIFEVTDKFTYYGIVGVIIVIGSHFEQFVMSCRIAGMDNELAAIGLILDRLTQQAGGITAAFKETDANFLCRDFLARGGFQQNDGQWVFQKGSAILKPAHIDASFARD